MQTYGPKVVLGFADFSAHDLFRRLIAAFDLIGGIIQKQSYYDDNGGEVLNEPICGNAVHFSSYENGVSVESHIGSLNAHLGGECLVSYADYSGLPADKRSVSVYISGSEFEHIPNKKYIFSKSLACYALFVKMCEIVGPIYASITVDYELEPPCVLMADSSSHAFADFFVNLERLDLSFDQVRGVVGDAFYERIGTGLYVSTTDYFNPLRIDLAPDGRKISSQVSKMVRNTLLRHENLEWNR